MEPTVKLHIVQFLWLLSGLLCWLFSLKHKSSIKTFRDIEGLLISSFNLQIDALLQCVTAHRRVKGSNKLCSIKICQHFIFVNFLFQPWLVLSFPRCKEEAALLLSLFPFFLFFFIFLLQHKTTYCDGPLKRKKKNSTTSSFWGESQAQEIKGTFFMDWTR